MEVMLKSKIARETLKAKSYDLDEVETRRVTIGEDFRRLLEKLADDKPVVRSNDKDKPERGTRSMTPNKSDICRKEIKSLLVYDMIEPSKSPWACVVVMTKKKETNQGIVVTFGI